MKKNKLTPGGNLLWESSRMMLPEHKREILAYQKSRNKKPKPYLDEQKKEQLSYLLAESVALDVPVTLTLYDPYEDIKITGKIAKIDPHARRLKIMHREEGRWIPFEDIIHMEKEDRPLYP